MSVSNGEKANAANFNSSFVSKEDDSTMVSKLTLARGASGATVDDTQSDINANTAHKDGDGSDHADVAANTAHAADTNNPHSTDIDDVTPTTTKGDIIAENGTNAVSFNVGTDGQVLTADSAEATGLKWVDPSAGGTAITKNQITHGFSLLDAIYHNGTIWVKAQADDGDTLAEYVVSEVVDVDNFTANKFGQITATAHGKTVGEHYFLSDTVAGDSTITEPTTYSAPVFYVEDANIIHVEVYRPSTITGGGGSTGTWDIVVPTDQATLTLANTNGASQDSVKLLTQATVENPSITKELGVMGGGRGSEITGNITFSSGSDGSSLQNLRVDGNITIDSGVKNLMITNVWITGTVTDNSGNSFNLLEHILLEG